MLNYLKRRFSSTELINEIKSGVGYGLQQSHEQTAPSQRPPQDYKYLPEEVRRQTVEEMYTKGTADSGQARGARMTFPSAPSSPTRQPSVSGSGGGFMNTVTGQLTKARHLFSTETLNSFISDVKVTGAGSKSKCKILLVIDHPLTDWAKYVHKRKLDADWEIRVEQAQLNDISITAFPDQGCLVTVQDRGGARLSSRTFKPDLVLIRQGFGTATQHYENLITGLMFSGVPCLNSITAVYNMRNKAWLFSHLLKIQKRLGPSEFPLIARTYQTRNQPLKPDFQMPVTVRLGGDSERECEVRVEDNTLFQSLVSLANSTQRYATTEPYIQTLCEVIIQRIGSFTKAFMRKSISNPSLGSSGSTVLEKIPVTQRFNQWITEVSQMFGGLDMCAVKVIQDVNGDYFIQDAYGSDFTLLGDGQEEDRARIAEILFQQMENLNKGALEITRTNSQSQVIQSPTKPKQTPIVCPSVPKDLGSQPVFSPPTVSQEQPIKSQFEQARPQQAQATTFLNHEQQPLAKPQLPASGALPPQIFKEPLSGPSRPPLEPQQKVQPQQDSPIQPLPTYRSDFTDRDSPMTASTRITSMSFPDHPQPPRTNYIKDNDGDKGTPIGATSIATSASRSTSEQKGSSPWISGGGGGPAAHPIREPSMEGPRSVYANQQKAVAPQPPRQPSMTFESNAGSGTPGARINTFDLPTDTLKSQTQKQPSMSTFHNQSQERDITGPMKFGTPSMDFRQSASGPQHNDPWSVPPSQMSTIQTQQTHFASPPFSTVSSLANAQSKQSSGNPDDADDTMKNLRKTFAGIFGDI